MEDLYNWLAVTQDGQYITEEGHGFADVEHLAVRALDLEPRTPFLPAHRVLVPDGASPVFFRRRRIEIAQEREQTNAGTIHCIGWKREHAAVYLFINEDGTTLLSNDLQAV